MGLAPSHVPDVEAALREAERLGGKRQMGPERAPAGRVAGYFTTPGQPDRRRGPGVAGGK